VKRFLSAMISSFQCIVISIACNIKLNSAGSKVRRGEVNRHWCNSCAVHIEDCGCPVVAAECYKHKWLMQRALGLLLFTICFHLITSNFLFQLQQDVQLFERNKTRLWRTQHGFFSQTI